MKVDLFVYGIPCGEDFWGNPEDKNYFGTFYITCSDEVKFLIQTCAPNGTPYCYYNYLVYKNVIGNDGRDGSYFGLTLRLDAYCKEFANMYRMLDMVYNSYVVGHLLKREGANLKYAHSRFADVSDILQNIETTIVNLMQGAFSNDSFTGLTGFEMKGSNSTQLNLYDCTEGNVMSAIKKHGRIAISPYYPSSKETAIKQQHDAQIQEMRQQSEASLSSAKKQASQLQNEIKDKDGVIGKLQKEVSRLQSDMQRIEQSKKVSQIVAPLREPIAELASTLKRMFPHGHTAEPERKSGFSVANIIRTVIPFLNFILLITIFCMLLFSSQPEVKDKYNDGAGTEQSAQGQFDNQKPQEEDSKPVYDISKIDIDIQEYNGKGPLKLGSTYTVEAKGSTDKGEWEGKGCSIIYINEPNKVNIIPKSSDVEILYCIKGQVIKRRNLTAK